jgi:protein tyrosine phosphatase (PTP) superfamily phosphohydrolase (DUF442 family)
VSQLLDAVAGLPNASEPLPGIVTGGQPTAEQLAALKRAGCEVVLDIREPTEPRPYPTPDAVRAAGLEYINIPFGHGEIADATFDRILRTVRELSGRKRVLFHCSSGNRVGAALIPYLMLDQGFEEDDAVNEAMRIGMRSAGLLERALEYVRRSGGRAESK